MKNIKKLEGIDGLIKLQEAIEMEGLTFGEAVDFVIKINNLIEETNKEFNNKK